MKAIDELLFCTEQSRDSKTASGLLKDDRASSSVAAERSSYAIEFNRGILLI